MSDLQLPGLPQIECRDVDALARPTVPMINSLSPVMPVSSRGG